MIFLGIWGPLWRECVVDRGLGGDIVVVLNLVIGGTRFFGVLFW